MACRRCDSGKLVSYLLPAMQAQSDFLELMVVAGTSSIRCDNFMR